MLHVVQLYQVQEGLSEHRLEWRLCQLRSVYLQGRRTVMNPNVLLPLKGVRVTTPAPLGAHPVLATPDPDEGLWYTNYERIDQS